MSLTPGTRLRPYEVVGAIGAGAMGAVYRARETKLHEFDMSADGQRFLFTRAEPSARPTRLDVIVNWFPGLARLATGQSR